MFKAQAEAADLLQFLSVKKGEQFLVRHLDIDNCIGMHSFAEFHVCPELEKESRRILCSRFKGSMSNKKNFLKSALKSFSYLVQKESLCLERRSCHRASYGLLMM